MAKMIWIATLAAAALIGCAGSDGNEDGELGPLDTEAETSEAAELGGLQQPLRTAVGPTRTGYTCAGLRCTCSGDDDCNDMFGDGVCGDISSCDASDPLHPTCECLMFKVSVPRSFAVADTAGAVFTR